MALATPYSLAPLPVGHPAFVARVPGVREVVRLFPEPSATTHGSLGVEGGLTFVAGPGMGRTTLLAHVRAALEAERRIPCAQVSITEELLAGGFAAFLGALAEKARVGLLESAPMEAPEHAPLRAYLERPVLGDVPESPGALTPRGLQGWIDELGRAAAQGRGCCLLFDDLDLAASREWANALVAGLRFTFQSASGITPIFALWQLYFEESLVGSNYFRNVTRPLFLSPLEEGERAALIDAGLPAMPAEARARVAELAGGHPALLQRLLRELSDALTPDAVAELTAGGVDGRLADGETSRRRAVSALLARVPQLLPALQKVKAANGGVSRSALPQALVTSGLLTWDEAGAVRVPQWLADGL